MAVGVHDQRDGTVAQTLLHHLRRQTQAAIFPAIDQPRRLEMPRRVKAVSLLRQKTGSMRSDADLEALIAKMAAARGVALVMDRKPDQFAPW